MVEEKTAHKGVDKTSQPGQLFIKNQEGLRLSAYQCSANVWTIGYGHTGGVKPGMKIDKPTAEKLFLNDLKRVENILKALVKVPLNQFQFDALASFVFNVGGGNFARSTLLRELNKGNYGAVPTQLRRWVHGSGGVKLKGLVLRREREIVIWNQVMEEVK